MLYNNNEAKKGIMQRQILIMQDRKQIDQLFFLPIGAWINFQVKNIIQGNHKLLIFVTIV